MTKPFCPDCGAEDLKTYRKPPGTVCNVCGWSGNLWSGHRTSMVEQDAHIEVIESALKTIFDHTNGELPAKAIVGAIHLVAGKALKHTLKEARK